MRKRVLAVMAFVSGLVPSLHALAGPPLPPDAGDAGSDGGVGPGSDAASPCTVADPDSDGDVAGDGVVAGRGVALLASAVLALPALARATARRCRRARGTSTA